MTYRSWLKAQISIKLDIEVENRVKEMSAEREWSKSVTINHILKKYFAAVDKSLEMRGELPHGR